MDNENTFQEGEDWRVSKLKSYGREAYRPFLDLVIKYQDAFVPYLRSLIKGLNAGGASLTLETDKAQEADRFVASLFNDTAKAIDELIRLLENKDYQQVSSLFNRLSAVRPSLAFSTSYVAGLFIGRLSRHIINEKKIKRGATSEVQGPIQ
jgi:hypothetical protein